DSAPDSSHADEPGERMVEIFSTWRWRTAFSLGLDPRLLQLVFGRRVIDRIPRDFAHQMRCAFEDSLSRFRAETNPYIWQLLKDDFLPNDRGLPIWLQTDHLPTIRTQ